MVIIREEDREENEKIASWPRRGVRYLNTAVAAGEEEGGKEEREGRKIDNGGSSRDARPLKYYWNGGGDGPSVPLPSLGRWHFAA